MLRGFGSSMKSDLSFGWDWGLKHLAESCENGMEFGIVSLFHFSDFAAQVFVRGKHGAKLEEGTHDSNIDLHGAITMQNAGEHGYTVFGEGVRTIATAAVDCQT